MNLAAEKVKADLIKISPTTGNVPQALKSTKYSNCKISLNIKNMIIPIVRGLTQGLFFNKAILAMPIAIYTAK